MFNFVPFARRILIKAFRKGGFQPGSFWHCYVANIACAIYDGAETLQVDKLEMAQCNVVAESIMLHLFSELKEDVKAERRQMSEAQTQPMDSGETVSLP